MENKGFDLEKVIYADGLEKSTNLESKYFLGLTDPNYLQFNKKLVTSVYPMEGVRLPDIRILAKKIASNKDSLFSFLAETPTTYEEIMLRGFVIGQEKRDIATLLDGVDSFLPLVDNWAVCDSFAACLKLFGKHMQQVFDHFAPLKNSPHVFHRRFLAVLLMDYFFVDEFIDRALSLLLQIKAGEYYVDMAVAWALATAAAKFFDRAYEIISGGVLTPFILRKSISKSLESFRLSPEQKDKLRQLRSASSI